VSITRRTVYALLPDTGTRPVDDEFLHELRPLAGRDPIGGLA
jgi:hypothetical protein